MKKNYQIQSLPRMFEQVAAQIVDFIQAEQLEPGTKFPTERNLCEQLQVSRSSVREGIRVLELLKYLESRQGEGTFVSSPPPFLIPLSVLKRDVGTDQLNHYYEVALMVAEKIMSLAIDQELPYQKAAPGVSFSEAFIPFISNLGAQLDNPYYASLWTDTIQLLINYDFFEGQEPAWDIQSFYTAYEKKDKLALSQHFHTLLKS